MIAFWKTIKQAYKLGEEESALIKKIDGELKGFLFFGPFVKTRSSETYVRDISTLKEKLASLPMPNGALEYIAYWCGGGSVEERKSLAPVRN